MFTDLQPAAKMSMPQIFTDSRYFLYKKMEYIWKKQKEH